MGLTLVTPAAAPAVSLADAKAWCRIDGTSDDTALAMALAGAIGVVEEFIGHSLAPQTWLLALDRFADVIELPRGPVTDIPSFTCLDRSFAAQAVDPAIWTLDLVSDPQRIVRNPDQSWPEVGDRANAIQITFTAATGTLPGPVQSAILSLTAQFFDNRSTSDVPPGIYQTLSPFRRLRI